MATSGREASLANLKPAQAGNTLAVRHGVASERKLAPIAARQRRTFLRRIGLRARDLDALGQAHLDLYTRLAAKVELCDIYLAQRGLIRADGEPEPILKVYVSLANSTRLALSRLEQHVHARATDPVADVQTWLDGLPEVEDDDEDDGAADRA